jgi:hypothetical protein
MRTSLNIPHTCNNDHHTTNGADIPQRTACLAHILTADPAFKALPRLQLRRVLVRYDTKLLKGSSSVTTDRLTSFPSRSIHLYQFQARNSTSGLGEDMKRSRECTSAGGMAAKKHMAH